MLDYGNYSKKRGEIDRAILFALDEPRTERELNEIVGDPAVRRAACNSLRLDGLVYDSWDLGRDYPRPFRIYRVGGRPVEKQVDPPKADWKTRSAGE
jgi:hypothetical protein